MLNKDELKYIIEDLHKNELSKTGKIKLEIYIIDLQHQIQSYKDKEDKIREYIKNEYFKREQIGIYDKKFQEFEVNKILQILNEGWKEMHTYRPEKGEK